MFGGYILVHLLVNATLIQDLGAKDFSRSVYQEQVNKIHGLPFLEFIEYGMIILPLTFHTLYGLYVTFSGQQNLGNYGYGKNWAYTLQRVSALVIFLFAAFHVVSMKGGLNWLGDFFNQLAFVPDKATQSTVNHMHASWVIAYVIYPLGILASTFHLANGFWTGAITWGLTVSRQAQQRFGYVCALIFLFTTVCGFAALATTILEKPSHLPDQANTERFFKTEAR
jgi:succinate dehydrogenase / fumarate reductase cytochrome b subunit